MSRQDRHPQTRIERRVIDAAERALAEGPAVSPLHVFSLMGWLPWNLVDQWQKGRFQYLMDRVQVGPDKLAKALRYFHRWAEDKGLEANEVTYLDAHRRPLRFTPDGSPDLERVFRTHWTPEGMSPAERERIVERESRPPDLVVVSPLGEWTCTTCGKTFGKGTFLIMEGPGPHCLICAGMDHLVYLPAGNAKLTRRARKASDLTAVVVRRSRARHRYERQGILVEETALDQAEDQIRAEDAAR